MVLELHKEKRDLKFCFVLPRSQYQPVGGYKIVYDYANRLVALGHTVRLLYLNSKYLKKYKLPEFARRAVLNSMTRIEPRWFPLDSKVVKISDMTKNYEEKLSDNEIAIATGISTVEYVLEHFADNQKGYLIQDFENWDFPDEYVFETYNSGLKNIVVSNWLKKIVDDHSKEPSILISNPIDLDIYKKITSYKERPEKSIGVLYHQSEHKGFKYALKVLEELKEDYPDIIVKNEKKSNYLWIFVILVVSAAGRSLMAG